VNARWSPSVTVAAIVHDGGPAADLRDPARRWLLVEEHTPEGLKLNNPAGHLDPAEGPLQGVVREALEETARVFTPEALLGVYLSRFVRPAPPGGAAQDVTYLRFAYLGTVEEALQGRALDAGIVRTLWLTLDGLRACRARHRSPLVLQCVEDAVAGVRHPLGLVRVDATVISPWVMGTPGVPEPPPTGPTGPMPG
jgi:8-oxo-dGTP pyrophosphatase MutT (NUDIX family)